MADSIVIPINNVNSTVLNDNYFIYTLPVSASFGDDCEICLGSGYIYNSVFNISQTYFNNNSYNLILPTASGPVTLPIVMPDGSYDVDTGLTGYMHLQQLENNYYLLDHNNNQVYFTLWNINIVYYSVTFTAFPTPDPANVFPYGTVITAGQYTYPPATPTKLSGWGGTVTNGGLPATPETPQVTIFSTNNFMNIIGFLPGTYPPTMVDVVYNIDSVNTPVVNPQYVINVNINMVNQTQYTSNPNSIFQFVFTQAFGSQQSLNPYQYQWYTLAQNQYTQIRVYFTDQNNRPLYLNDSNTQLNFLIRKKEARGSGVYSISGQGAR